jgi:hypothetical protein
MYFLLAQLVWILWAIAFAHFQCPLIKAMRDYVPINNPYKKAFHDRGALLSSFVACIIGVSAFLLSVPLIHCAFLIPLFYCIYKILFDGIIGIEVYRDFYYEGTTAKQDAWINKHFPHDKAGEIKVAICGIVILALNVLNFFL